MNRRITVSLLLALVLSFGLLSSASAHAKLVSSDPAAGARLTTAPSKITLVFSEEISDKADESNVTVTNEQGATVGTGKLDTTDLDHKTQTATLKAGLGDGIYTVKWNAVTTDDQGHTNGSFTFGVNKDPGAQATAAPEPTDMDEATPTVAAGSTTQPTTKPAVVPTATVAAAPNPGTLPQTGADESHSSWYMLLAALAILIGGLVVGYAVTRRHAEN